MSSSEPLQCVFLRKQEAGSLGGNPTGAHVQPHGRQPREGEHRGLLRGGVEAGRQS